MAPGSARRLIKKLPTPGFINAVRWSATQQVALWTEIGELVHDLKEFGWAPLGDRLPRWAHDKREWVWEDAANVEGSSIASSGASSTESESDEPRERGAGGRGSEKGAMVDYGETTEEDTDADERALV